MTIYWNCSDGKPSIYWGQCTVATDWTEEHLLDVVEVTGWARWDGLPWGDLFGSSFVTVLAKRLT